MGASDDAAAMQATMKAAMGNGQQRKQRWAAVQSRVECWDCTFHVSCFRLQVSSSWPAKRSRGLDEPET
jgi:hypothetical protein